MSDTALLLGELAVLFFGVAFGVQLIQRRLGPERLRSLMGGTPVAASLKGIGFGFVTPFCTYSAIPMLIGFRQAGVPPAGYVAFITAAPVLDPVLFGALVLIVGPTAAVLYATIAFIAAMTLALTAQRVGIERHLKPIPALSPASHKELPQLATTPAGGRGARPVKPTATSCNPEQSPWTGLGAESVAAARSALALLRSVAPLLLVGVGIGLAIEALISPGDVARITGGQTTLSIPVAAALGTPLYFSTSLFVPIADALSGAGVGIGAIVALTIAGAGANIPEIIVLNRLADGFLIGTFVAYVFSVALFGGLLAQLLLG